MNSIYNPKRFEGGARKTAHGRGEKAHTLSVSMESIRDLPSNVLAE